MKVYGYLYIGKGEGPPLIKYIRWDASQTIEAFNMMLRNEPLERAEDWRFVVMNLVYQEDV